MKCDIPESVTRRCDEFVGRFNISNTSQATRNIFHNKNGKKANISRWKLVNEFLVYCKYYFDFSIFQRLVLECYTVCEMQMFLIFLIYFSLVVKHGVTHDS